MMRNYLLRKGYVLIVSTFILLNISCKSSDDEIPLVQESRLKEIQAEFMSMPTVFLEFSEDGRPISETNRSFIYDSNNELIQATENTGRFILTTGYSYANDLLIRYDTPTITSSDMVIQITGEVSYKDFTITRTATYEGEVKYWQMYTFQSADYRYITKIENILGPSFSGPNILLEYIYDVNFNLTSVNESEVDRITGDVELKYSYIIEYDDMNNPFEKFINQNPIVFGLLKFSFDTSTLSTRTAIEPMVRRNGLHNITKISQVNANSGSTFDWNFEYVYNDNDYPIEKKRIDENGETLYNMTYSYY